ncbi:ABC transporter substrate-binding protein [Verminephrobacter eiseniae]|uniref:Extracellular solute-binding protein, family 1 n=1 Tax=Verminephrobacter eiseniae (strain EF01-2) TaxID=391735 RepID=A1WQ42_VEREI|nr:ABC transporter substrate-binding protein [Verminephrobacter eiseniae]ABM59749.1 extracellular solute-binding protein, family 1 [Verminephrobacter eiseniae EF01-2]MCW5231827.1 ABC transporter substrate-binding protein [Verminephrobacter eiseniae]MCW5260109.1 ABC transporter substrate-binding protein [Verminephrobacter eiseniae]MCW5293561.1 ABC transporter substrate-binding protein [Verminephrobacter eiseniae]MCW8186202.1 ABC transporter substrate-binding protein [Verminephrobacter eiseniae]
MKNQCLLACAALCAGMALPGLAQQSITVVNFGGAAANAQKKAYYEPYEKQTGSKIVALEYNGEQAKLKAMVEAKKVTWDVLEVETPDAVRGCDEGLFEKIDYSRIASKNELMPDAITDCAVGFLVWSTVMAYNGDKLKTAPGGWADFFDTQKIPGKRGMRKGARYNLEFALLADGVKPADVYPLLATREGADRAFKKLTALKPHIQWWAAGAQVPQFLVAGDVVLSTAYNGRIDAANREGRNLRIHWPGSIYDLEYWTIPKGAPNKDEALKFIAFSLQADNQAVYVRQIAYGPTNTKAMAQLDAKTLERLPTSANNARQALRFDVGFWADQGEMLEKRFAVWATQ